MFIIKEDVSFIGKWNIKRELVNEVKKISRNN